jgi:serine/threonine-protein kinase
VAIKSMHPQLAKDPSFRAMFVDEANLTARIRHPNVVPTLDIVSSATRLLIVMEYVEGVSLSVLLRAARAQNRKLPVPVVVTIMKDLLEGLHAAHELADDHGQPLNVVHRDVSPQNVLVGVDGISRVVDFGVAKAAGRSYHTQTGEIRGKVGYMAPEQMFGEAVDRRVDVYAAGVVLWESLAGDRLFNAPTDAALVLLVMQKSITAASLARGEHLPDGLDDMIRQALSHDIPARFATTLEMMNRLVAIVPPASREEVSRIVRELAPQELELRSSYVKQSSSPSSLDVNTLEPEARAVLDVLTRATMTRDNITGPAMSQSGGKRMVLPMGAAFGLLAAVGVASGIGYMRRAHPAAASSERVLPTASATAEPPAPPSAEASSPSASSSAAAPPLASADPSAAASAAAKLKHNGQRKLGGGRPVGSAPAAPPSSPPASGPAKPDCNPQYTTDELGIRHYKPECLK